MPADPPFDESLPTNVRGLNPEELMARGMHSVRVSSSGGAAGWKPPSVEEMARLIPHYEIIGLVGRGGMGAVYQGRQTALERMVAIKVLPLEISVQRDFAERFIREARAMARLEHPNVMTVYDFGQTVEGHFYYVMDFINGTSLHELIRTSRVAPHEALAIVEQVCDALAYAHLNGVIHRDVKPANVMVDRRGRVKVLDFGLARLANLDGDYHGTTMTGTVLGTPDYMSPEQKLGAHVDYRADVYSVGVLLYEALAGVVPQGVFEPLSKRANLDRRLDTIVARAMAQVPEKRYQSTMEIRAALSAIRPALTRAFQKAKPASSAAPVGERLALPAPHVAPVRKLQAAMLWLAGGAVVVAVLLSFWLLSDAEREPDRTATAPAPDPVLTTAPGPTEPIAAAPELAPPPLPKPWPVSTEPWQELIGDAERRELRAGAREEEGVLHLPTGAKFQATSASGDGAMAIRLHYQPGLERLRLQTRGESSNGCYAVAILSPQVVSLDYESEAGFEPLQRFRTAAPLEPGDPCELEVRWVGPQLTARLNGIELGSVSVPAHPKRLFSVENGSTEAAQLKGVRTLALGEGK